MTRFRLLVLLLLFSWVAGGLKAQLPAETADLTAEEMYRWPGAKLAELQAVFWQRYDTAATLEARHEWAKYLARVHYRLSQTDQVKVWQARVDSLADLLAEVPYDRSYEMHRISQAYATGEPAVAFERLEAMRPQMEASGDTLWRLNWLAKRVQGRTKIKDYAQVMQDLLTIERLNEAYGDSSIFALTHVLHADLHWEKGEKEAALRRFLQAAAAYEAIDNPDMLLPVYTNLMTMAAHLEEEAIAIRYADKLSELRRSYGSDIGYFSGEENKIFFYIRLKQFQAAKKQALHTLRLADSLGRSPAHATYLLGVAYRGMVDYDSAAFHIERAFEMGKERQHFGQMAFYAHALYQTYYWDERFEPALAWHIIHIQYRDSVYDERKAKEIAVLEANFETLEQERKVTALETQAALDRKKRQLLWLAIGLGSLLAVALIYGQRQRAHSQRLAQQAAIDKLQMEKQQLERELEYKQRELASQMLNMTQKNQLLQTVEAELQPLREKHHDPAVSNLLRLIERHISNDDDWAVFLRSFRAIHATFLDQLKARAESLSANDIRLASLLKMNLSSKEISTLLNITDEGVKKARYRLRKKLQLDSGVSLQDYLVGL